MPHLGDCSSVIFGYWVRSSASTDILPRAGRVAMQKMVCGIRCDFGRRADCAPGVVDVDVDDDGDDDDDDVDVDDDDDVDVAVVPEAALAPALLPSAWPAPLAPTGNRGGLKVRWTSAISFSVSLRAVPLTSMSASSYTIITQCLSRN